MLVGYKRVSKSDGSQVMDLQDDAIRDAGVDAANVYSDMASGSLAQRPGLDACIKSLRPGDLLVVWRLDRLGRSLRHLVNLVGDLTRVDVGLRILAGTGSMIDTTTPNGRLMFGLLSVLAEFERDLIVERTRAGVAAARARGRHGGRRHKVTPTAIRMAQAAMGQPETVVADLSRELGLSPNTIYRYVGPDGVLRPLGVAFLAAAGKGKSR